MLNQLTVAKVNNVDIIAFIVDGEKRVAIKPICEVLGISIQGQLERIKSVPILSSTIKICFTVGADEKNREMQTIPFKYVFGWLFSIDAKKVKPEAQEAVLKYQLKCYDVLYDHFTIHSDFVEKRQSLTEERLLEVSKLENEFIQSKAKLGEAKTKLKEALEYSFEDYKRENAQLTLNLE